MIIFIKTTDFVERSNYAKTVISVGNYGEVAPVNPIKLVDGITNPYISDTAKYELYNKLSEYLDKNWHNSPVGINYKWALNDAQIAADTQYIGQPTETDPLSNGIPIPVGLF